MSKRRNRRKAGKAKELRSMQSRELSFDTVFDSLGRGLSMSGSIVNPISVPALNQGVRIITDSIASLPIGCDGNQVIDGILYRPNKDQTSIDFLTVVVNSLLWNANAYIEKQYGDNGSLTGLVAHHYHQISVERISNGHRYRYTDIFGNTRVMLESEIIHIRYNSNDKVFGRSPVQECREAIGLANTQQNFIANYNSNGSKSGGILSTEKSMSPESIQKFKKAWEDRHAGVENANKVSVLTDGFKYDSVGHDVLQSDFIRQYTLFAIQEVSRILNIPPTMLNDYSNSTYTNSETARRILYDTTLRPWLSLIESAISAGLGLPRGMEVKFDPAPLLRLNHLDQANAAQALMNAGVMTINEWREKNGLAPIEGGDVLPTRQPTQPNQQMEGSTNAST